MNLVRVRGDSGPVRVEYVAPPVPEVIEPEDGKFIELPREEDVQRLKRQGPETEKSTSVTTLTLEGGFNIYLERADHDWTAAERYVEAINLFLHSVEYLEDEHLGLPKSEHPDLCAWLTRYTLTRMQGIHDQVTVSPLAIEKVGPRGGERILVPGTGIPVHGQKRNH